MRVVIRRGCNKPAPGVLLLGIGQLRKHIARCLAQALLSAPCTIIAISATSAHDEAAGRIHSEVVQQSSRVRRRLASWQNRGGDIVRKRLGGNLYRSNGNDRLCQRRDEAICIAVGAKKQFSCAQPPVRRFYDLPARFLLYA